MKLKHIRSILIGIVVVFALMSFGLSAQNSVSSTSLSDQVLLKLGLIRFKDITSHSVRYAIWVSVIRQTAHFLLYTLGSIPVYMLIYTYTEKLFRVTGLTVLIVAMYALTDEIHQLFVAGRSFQPVNIILLLRVQRCLLQ